MNTTTDTEIEHLIQEIEDVAPPCDYHDPRDCDLPAVWLVHVTVFGCGHKGVYPRCTPHLRTMLENQAARATWFCEDCGHRVPFVTGSEFRTIGPIEAL